MRLFISILLIFKIKNIIAKTDTPPMIENDAALLPVIKNNIRIQGIQGNEAVVLKYHNVLCLGQILNYQYLQYNKYLWQHVL